MIAPVTLHRWGFAVLFAVLSALIIFARMLPLDGTPEGMPPPDLIGLIGFAWVLRRPDFVPVLLFASVLLVTDLLFLRAPGVWTALSVIGLEFLRARAPLLRDQPLAVEWVTVAGVLAAMMVGERLVLSLFLVQQVSLGLSIMGLLANIAFYPVVVAISLWAFRVRRLHPGEHAAEARLV